MYDGGGRTKGKRLTRKKLLTVTAFLFVTTQVAALGWVTLSYLIAAYATVRLGQPYPIESLSETAITALLGTSALKVLGNIFEHNDGAVFGKSDANNNDTGCA